MNTLKTVFLAALLSAAAYGVYFAVNGPPRTSGGGTDWEAGPPVVVSNEGASAPPEVTADPAGAAGETSPAGTGGEPPAFAPSPADGGAVLALPPADGAQPLADGGAAPSDQRYPSTEAYSPDRMPLGPDEAQSDAAAEPRAAPDRYPSTDRYADRYSGAAAGAEADRYSPTDTGANEALAAGDPAGNTAPDDDVHAEFATLMQSADQMLREGRLAEAHLELSSLYGTPGLTLDEEGRLTDLLDRLAGTVIYSRQHLLHPAYEVQPGDTLERIADAYEVPWQLLANINGIREPGRLRPGDTLKVVKGPFDAYVDLSSFRLVLYVNGRYAGRFPIGIGKDRATPLGDFQVVKKVENPVYYGDQVVPAGDPNNPLGPYALDLDKGIFIHGTNDPSSIGRAESRGCVRLNNRDIKDLFEILTAKSEHSAGSHVSIIQSAADPAAGEPAPSGPILPPAETAGRPPASPGSQRPSRL